MKRRKINLLIVVMMIGMLIPAISFCQEEIEIQVSPSILNLQSNGVVVTIHTDIPFSQVSAQTVSMNGLEIDSWKSDNQGFFVAKFDMDEVKELEGLEIGEYNTLTLNGLKVSGDTFTGSEDVLVINNIPKGKK
jgi:hypothetical protein